MSTEDVTAEIAAVLAEHQRVNSNAAPCLCEEWPDGETDWPTHLADALADLLAARDRRVRAEAWDEGYEAGEEDSTDAYWSPATFTPTVNPYREADA